MGCGERRRDEIGRKEIKTLGKFSGHRGSRAGCYPVYLSGFCLTQLPNY